MGKDKTECSYRPISVLNMNYRLYASILEDIIPDLIDQTGFFKNRNKQVYLCSWSCILYTWSYVPQVNTLLIWYIIIYVIMYVSLGHYVKITHLQYKAYWCFTKHPPSNLRVRQCSRLSPLIASQWLNRFLQSVSLCSFAIWTYQSYNFSLYQEHRTLGTYGWPRGG